MADNGVDIYRDDVGYPYIRLKLDNLTTTRSSTTSVSLSFRITAWVNGYFLSPNYGGTWYLKTNNTSGTTLASATYINGSSGYGDSSGSYIQVYQATKTATLTVSGATTTTATLCLQSYCDNSAWTSLNFSKTFTISFASGSIAVTGISISPTSATIDVGGTRNMTATIAPSDATNKTVNWSTSNSSVATVSGGVVTGKAAGQCTITATAAGNTSKTATCSVTVVQNTGPNGSVNATTDTTWSNEKAIRVDHQTIYGLTVAGTYMDNVTVGGTQMEKITVGGQKVWFRVGNRTSAISCSNFARSGSTTSNTSGGCASIDHCSNLFSSNRTNPIRPKQLTMSYVMNTLRTQTTARTARVRLFGRNSNGNWVEISLSNNSWTLAANSAASSGSLTITASTKNFFTNFKIGIFPDDKSYFIATCTLTSISITSYDVDESLE